MPPRYHRHQPSFLHIRPLQTDQSLCCICLKDSVNQITATYSKDDKKMCIFSILHVHTISRHKYVNIYCIYIHMYTSLHSNLYVYFFWIFGWCDNNPTVDPTLTQLALVRCPHGITTPLGRAVPMGPAFFWVRYIFLLEKVFPSWRKNNHKFMISHDVLTICCLFFDSSGNFAFDLVLKRFSSSAVNSRNVLPCDCSVSCSCFQPPRSTEQKQSPSGSRFIGPSKSYSTWDLKLPVNPTFLPSQTGTFKTVNTLDLLVALFPLKVSSFRSHQSHLRFHLKLHEHPVVDTCRDEIWNPDPDPKA